MRGKLLRICANGKRELGMICFCTVVPGMIIGIIILMLKARETRGVNLEEIGEGNE